MSAQQPEAIFTAEQTAEGKVIYERSCAQCHRFNPLGRNGSMRATSPLPLPFAVAPNPQEFPPLNTLTEHYLKFVGPRRWVPPLDGTAFLKRWGDKSRGDGPRPGAKQLPRSTNRLVNSVVQYFECRDPAKGDISKVG